MSSTANTSLTTHTLGALECLAFCLGDEEYGVHIQQVQELRGYDAVTRIANMPEYIKGVINLRGVIVPIIDMRIKFGLGNPSYDQFTVVIILNLGDRTVGIVVDSVSDVINLKEGQVKPAPNLGSARLTEHVIGLGSLEDRMLILLDINKILSSDDLNLLSEIEA